MKKIVLPLLATAFAVVSCTYEKDLYQGEPITPDDAGNAVSKEAIKENMEKVFGVSFDPNHDWCSTTRGEVTFMTDPSVKKVQILAYVQEIDQEGLDDDVTTNGMKVLNEATVNGQSSIKLDYDAPKDHLGLYAAFHTAHSCIVKKIDGNTVSSSAPAQSRMTRALSTGYTLPQGEFAIGEIVESFASQRGWIPGEMLYGLGDYTSQVMTSPDYSDEFKELFMGIVFSYFPNGRAYNNLPKVKESGYYNSKVYPITTGDEPIILTPMYKRDSATKYGNEIYNSDLYYYYFKESDLYAGMDTVAYLQGLPKYKAIPFNQCFGEEEDNVITKHGSYALLYFGEGQPEMGTVGSYEFPQGYKLGFMVRAKTDVEGGKKQGEVYGDGRLNNKINNYGNFKSSKLGTNGPRVAWLSLNNKMLMCWESGTDADFNDVIIDVEGGIEPFDSIPDLDPEVYTYCFEDTPLGDYDINDVVIKAWRVNETTVQYSVIACGAYDELCIRNINAGVINDTTEVHRLFGKQPNQFINTDGGAYCEPVTVTKTVPKTFSFLDPATQPYIYDRTTDITVKLAEKGEDPHGIMIPNDFEYPREKICVKDAYPQFNSWGQNSISSVLWYTAPKKERVYQKKQ